MSVFGKVLYATDFSPLAEYALKFVKKLKSAGTEEVVIVHVVDSRTTALPDGADLIEKKTELALELPENEAKHLYELIERTRAIERDLKKEGFKTRLCLKAAPDVSKTVLEIAEKEKVDVIILGAHGKSLLAQLILGSVSLEIVRKAKCPVLLVKKRD
ncbi:universal stress protein [Desulfurobacterium sp.]